MRMTANVNRQHHVIKRVMLQEIDNACYAYLYDTFADRPCVADGWYESVDEAKRVCLDVYGIGESDWEVVPDPPPGCQHDIIVPTKILRNSRREVIYKEVDGRVVFDRRDQEPG